jgi:hypothetical protein
VLDTHSPLVCLSITPLYGLCYSPALANFRHLTFRTNPHRPSRTLRSTDRNIKHRDTPKYKEGDQVWLEGKNLRINQPTAKLVPRRHGPFKIIQVMSAINYRLELPTQWRIHPVFHIDLLTPYRETIMHGPNFTWPTPELIDGEEEYSVERSLDSRRYGRRR